MKTISKVEDIKIVAMSLTNSDVEVTNRCFHLAFSQLERFHEY
jgi:hypothetical protein